MNDVNELRHALERALRKIEALEERLRGIEQDQSLRNLPFTAAVTNRTANLENLWGVFFGEMMRAQGGISGDVLAAAEEKARARFVEDGNFGLRPESAERNLQSVRSAFLGDYKTPDDFDPNL